MRYATTFARADYARFRRKHVFNLTIVVIQAHLLAQLLSALKNLLRPQINAGFTAPATR